MWQLCKSLIFIVSNISGDFKLLSRNVLYCFLHQNQESFACLYLKYITFEEKQNIPWNNSYLICPSQAEGRWPDFCIGNLEHLSTHYQLDSSHRSFPFTCKGRNFFSLLSILRCLHGIGKNIGKNDLYLA